MDFKSLISKIESIDGKIDTPKAPELPKSVQLNEDAQLRVLSGRTTYVAEAKKKAEEDVKEATKTDKPWTDMKGNKHTGTAVKGKNYTGKEAEKDDDKDDEPKAKKAKKESVEPEFKSKFMKMVEAKKDDAADKKKKMAKKEKMAEGSKPDFLDMDKDGDKEEPMKKAVADKKDGPKKGVNPFAKKAKNEAVDPAKENERHARQAKGIADQKAKFAKEREDGTRTGPKVDLKKRPVKESIEQKLSFKQMVQLVQESGGQQQIDAVDKALFTWAERVARNKLGEGMKADLYAGLVYERNGGVFEMYDVLSETQK